MEQDLLIKCIDCGKPLHRAADICPACKSRAPQGLQCRICSNRDSAAHLISMRFSRYGDPDSDWSVTAHTACMKRIGLLGECTSCGAAFDDQALQSMLRYVPYGTFGLGVSFPPDEFRCGVCRAPNPLQIISACNHCWAPVSESTGVRRGRVWFHPECVAKKRSTNTGCLGVLALWLP